jgi:hypothetical protein
MIGISTIDPQILLQSVIHCTVYYVTQRKDVSKPSEVEEAEK